MASTYVNNLRLNEMATGDASGSWGTVTNTNLEIIGQAVAWGTRAIANASTDNITIADGALDADRCLGLKLTGGGQACTVTLLPNTSSKTWFMYNATSYTLTFTCGSGANVAILAGETKVIATDGLGSGGVVHDLLTAVNLAGTTKTAALTNAGALSNQGTVTVGVDDTGYDVQFFGATSGAYMLWDESADDLKLVGAAGLTVAGDIDVDGTTNLDVVDIDGAVDMASTLQVDGAITTDGAFAVANIISSAGSNTSTNVTSSMDAVGVKLRNTSDTDGNFAPIDFANSADALVARIGAEFQDAGDKSTDLFFATRANSGALTEQLRIDSAGAITATGKITADAGIDIDNINIDGTTIALSSGNLLLDVAGNITLDADTSNIFLADAGTNKVEIDWGAANVAIKNVTSDGDLIFGGNDGGVAITALTLDMSAAGLAIFNAGIALGGTGAANTLSDYEEGSWTPSIGGTATYHSQGGRYTKVGNMVTLYMKLHINLIGTGSNTTVSGLPFASSNTDTSEDNGAEVSFFSALAGNFTKISMPVTENASTMTFNSLGVDGGTGVNTNVDCVQNNAKVSATITYRTGT